MRRHTLVHEEPWWHNFEADFFLHTLEQAFWYWNFHLSNTYHRALFASMCCYFSSIKIQNHRAAWNLRLLADAVDGSFRKSERIYLTFETPLRHYLLLFLVSCLIYFWSFLEFICWVCYMVYIHPDFTNVCDYNLSNRTFCFVTTTEEAFRSETALRHRLRYFSKLSNHMLKFFQVGFLEPYLWENLKFNIWITWYSEGKQCQVLFETNGFNSTQKSEHPWK